MEYTTEERIAYLEKLVAMQSEQINRLQQCVNALVEYSDLCDDKQTKIVNVLCGDENEFIVNPDTLFKTEEDDRYNKEKGYKDEQENNSFDKFSSDDQDVLQLFFSTIDNFDTVQEDDVKINPS